MNPLEAARMVSAGIMERHRPTFAVTRAIVMEQLTRKARGVIGYKVFGDPFRHLDWLAAGNPPSPPVKAEPKNPALSRSLSSRLRMRLWQATKGHCGLCGTLIARSEVTIDHVVPRSKGGRNGGNVIPAHSHCNRAKADRMPTDAELRTLDRVNRRLGELV